MRLLEKILGSGAKKKTQSSLFSDYDDGDTAISSKMTKRDWRDKQMRVAYSARQEGQA
jgi:hypothetical protein